MVRNFKGVVKVADVQVEFDALLTTINDAIDKYNEGLELSGDIDFNNGGAELAPLGYTLSIGGLKAVLDAYNGALLGGMVFRSGTGNYIVSEGIYIKDREIFRLPSKPVAGTGNIVYFNTDSENYSFSNISGESGYYQDIVTTTTSPTINGSNSAALGTLSSSVSATYDGTHEFYPYMAFPSNSVRRFIPLVTNGTEYTLIWNFLNPTELQSISFTYGIFGGGKMQVLDLSNNVLLQDTVSGSGTNATKNYTGSFSTGNTKYNGIKIRLYDFDTANIISAVTSFSTFCLGDISLTGKTITRVYVPASAGDPEDFIEIAEVNTNRIARLCNTQKAVNEDIPDYKMTIQPNNLGYSFTQQNVDTSSSGQFASGTAGRNNYISLFGSTVSYHQWHGDRTDSYWEPTNYLFIPKGISNPYIRTGGESLFYMPRRFEYNLTRPERE